MRLNAEAATVASNEMHFAQALKESSVSNAISLRLLATSAGTERNAGCYAVTVTVPFIPGW